MNKATDMNQPPRHWRKPLLMLLGCLTMVTSANALPFVYQDGDLCLGFRKTVPYVAPYEIVVDLGPATNYENLAAGVTTNINQYSASQIDPDSYANWTNLQWSVTAEVPADGTLPGYPANTVWVTVPRVSGAPSKSSPVRGSESSQQAAGATIISILSGAVSISSSLTSNQDNTATFVREATATADGLNYGAFMADQTIPAVGDLASTGPLAAGKRQINFENTTVAPFTTASQSDFYEVRPIGDLDPHSGLTNGAAYNVGYFQFNPNGSMTFTRASAVSVPSAGSIGSSSGVTNGFSPLTVVFTNSATGSITNWVWNFGNGTVITNTTGANVTNTYTVGGSFTVTLTVYGPGGTNAVTVAHYIVASPTPTFAGVTLANGKLVFSGTNLPAGVQYRILNATNVSTPLANWKPVLTNTFSGNGSFAYTNSFTNTAGFFRLVSP